jgi:squalene synthase HpnC
MSEAEAAARAWPPVADPPDVLGQAREENFPVALRVLPRPARRDLMALYGFARLVDDLGDEVPGDRLAALDGVEAELARSFAGAATHPILRALEPTIRAHDLRPGPFRALIEANRRDQRVARTETWDELVRYCALSANPVGRLVLAIFDAATPEREALSDAICTALQVIEHCQDVAEDALRGRVYLPREDLARFVCSDAELVRAPATPALRSVVAFQIARARALLAQGEPLLAALHGPARLAVAGFAAGGHAACDALARARFDVTSATVRPRRTGQLVWLLRLLVHAWRSS